MIAVYGASGFIGSHFMNAFHDVEAQGRDEIIPRHPTILFLASTVDNYNVFTNPTLDIETNQILTVRVLEEARKKYGKDFTFLYVSTWFVYGAGGVAAKESFSCSPRGFYSITRHAGEQLVRSYCETFGGNFKIVRLANVLGVGDRKASLKKNAIQYLIQEISSGRNVTIYDEPSIRDIIDVRDCVFSIRLVLEAGEVGEIYNIGNGEEVNVKELLESVRRMNFGYGNISYMPVPLFHKEVQTSRFVMDISKITELGYKRKYKLDDTIKWIIGNNNEK